ncbi:hypothetical protein EGI22_08365 [Lacihabitans sp. LS3-19]|nr:hypothetical protein [Lacihabitans sp. LS3-19]
MLEYTKIILDKVSFEPKLFRKELRKAIKYVSKDEYAQLKMWCKQKFKRSPFKRMHTPSAV